ncbi:MAG: YidC/Oxa1 family membrane protein insertase [Candidatus Promineifilaceae bacterium]|nr:YidC/Oxa1 family membrane protein insertase [Candidatus Promineifilaceae bacterium]
MWDTFIIDPMVNALLVLYGFLGTNFFLAIAVFTVLIRLVTLPLNLKQQKAMMRMQEMQPEIQKIRKKYGDNPQKMQEEMLKIGVTPGAQLAGCLPLLLQFPILIGLYQAIYLVLGSTPQAMFELTQRVYSMIDLTQLLPINNQFYWLNLAQPDPYFVLPILVAATTFASQKLLTAVSPKKEEDDKKGKEEDENPMAGMASQMQIMMPLMMGFAALSFPAGVSFYWVLSSVIGAAQSLLIRLSMPDSTQEKLAGENPELQPVEAEVAQAAASSGKTSGRRDSKNGSRSRSKKRSRRKKKRSRR